MRTASRLRKFFLALTIFGALSGSYFGQVPNPQIKAEIERLQHSLKEKPVSDAGFLPLSIPWWTTLSKGLLRLSIPASCNLGLEKLLQAEDLLQGAASSKKIRSREIGIPCV